MRYLKMFGLVAVAAAAMMAFAGSASATTATAPSGTVYSGTVFMTGEGVIVFRAPADVTCSHSTWHGHIEKWGAGILIRKKVTHFGASGCNQHVSIVSSGTQEISHIPGTNDGTVRSSGLTITMLMTTIFGNVHCNYATNNTHIGRLTAAPTNTGHATLDLNAQIPVAAGSSGLCGSSAEWTGSYKVNSPTGLRIDA